MGDYMDVLESCALCPRNCRVNRYKTKGGCGADNKITVAHYGLHMWEEPIISGEAGSGTIFFSYCNLKCIFCQNYKISTEGYGKEIRLGTVPGDLAGHGPAEGGQLPAGSGSRLGGICFHCPIQPHRPAGSCHGRHGGEHPNPLCGDRCSGGQQQQLADVLRLRGYAHRPAP